MRTSCDPPFACTCSMRTPITRLKCQVERYLQTNYLLSGISIFYDRDVNKAKRQIEEMRDHLPESVSAQLDLFISAIEGDEAPYLGIDTLGFIARINLYDFNCSREELKSLLQELDEMIDSGQSLGYRSSYLWLKNGYYFKCIKNEPEFLEVLAKTKKVHDERMAKYGHLFDEE